MKIPRSLKISAFLFFMISAGGAGYGWIELGPTIKELQKKDPEKFSAMIEQVKSLHFPGAMKLFREIDAMTYEEVLELHYRTWKKKAMSDKEFNLAHWEKEAEARARARKVRKEKYQEDQMRILQVQDKRENPEPLTDWQEASPWEKALMLRENCVKYFDLEIEEYRRRGTLHRLPNSAALLQNAAATSTVPELCEELVVISHDERDVQNSLKNLKDNMNYFFLVQMLDEIGIPRNEVFSFSTQLNRMTGGLSDS